MEKKARFKLEINRIKLSQEQAVLYCHCHISGLYAYTSIDGDWGPGSEWENTTPIYACYFGSPGKQLPYVQRGPWRGMSVDPNQISS